MIRPAHAAGRFYPGEAEALEKTVDGLLKKDAAREDALAVIVPHAGYIYSGAVAGAVFSSVNIPDDVILMGPNHTGLGDRIAIMASGEWETPLGRVEVSHELASGILDACRIATEDASAHVYEHSLEVELPFIQRLNPSARIAPITLMHLDYRACSELASALASVIMKKKTRTLMVISSDMNHYESDDVTRRKDKVAIERALKLDARGLLDVAGQRGISMCGVVPAAVGIEAAKKLGASKARLVMYDTSARTSNDFEHVVGYAGIVIG